MKNMSKKKKMMIIGGVLGAIVGLVVILNIFNSEGYKINKQKKLADGLLKDYKNGALSGETALVALGSMRNNTNNRELETYIQNNISEIEETEEEIDELAKPKVEVSANKHYSAGLQEVRIKVENKGDKDISYLRIDFFEVTEDGQTVGSDWTNNKGAIIRAGSTVYLETYYDYYTNGTTLEFEVSDVKYK